MDSTALSAMQEDNMPIVVFNALEKGHMLKLAKVKNWYNSRKGVSLC